MTSLYVTNSLELARAIEAPLPDGAVQKTIEMMGGVYTDPLDSYMLPIRGGQSWTTALRIKPHGHERVILRPTASAQHFALLLAHGAGDHIDIGSDLVDLEFDASNLPMGGAATGIKVTAATGQLGPRVRLRRPKVYRAFHQGILNTLRFTEILGGSASQCGHSGNADEANKDHGLYLGKGSFDCKVIGFSTWGNAAYGVHEYGGEDPGGVGRNLIDGGKHFCNGRLADRSGILLGGIGSQAINLVSAGNQYGVHVYRTARGCSFGGDLHGNRLGGYFIDPAAIGTIVLDDP